MVPKTESDVPETLFGHLNSNGTISGGIAIPGLASWLSDPATGTSTVIQGLDTVSASERPTTREVNVVHLAWDVMVGLGTMLSLLAVWYFASLIFRRRMPQSKLFLWIAAASGVMAVFALEAGWVVTEVGRQPWIVRNYMKVGQGATTNEGVWVTFLVVLALYVAVAVTLVLILRKMSRRWREGEAEPDAGGPYEPRPEPTKELVT
jgi:cytochrome d ubiquinol oxidase subunit I